MHIKQKASREHRRFFSLSREQTWEAHHPCLTPAPAAPGGGERSVRLKFWFSSFRFVASEHRSRSRCRSTMGGTMLAAAASLIGCRIEWVKLPLEM